MPTMPVALRTAPLRVTYVGPVIVAVLTALILSGCSFPGPKPRDLAGTWVTTDGASSIAMTSRGTITASNVPVAISNDDCTHPVWVGDDYQGTFTLVTEGGSAPFVYTSLGVQIWVEDGGGSLAVRLCGPDEPPTLIYVREGEAAR